MEPRVEAFYIGPAPFDYMYIVEQEEEKAFVSISYNEEMLIYQVTKHRVFGDNNAEDVLEKYQELEDSATSAYFRTFLNLDRILDEKIRSTKEKIIDTKYYGIRFGAGIQNGENIAYVECFNSNQPEYKEYLQVIKKNNKYYYSASHTSYFMQFQLGEVYKYYFGEANPEEYYLKIEDLKDLDEKYWYFAQPFVTIRNMLDEGLWESGADVLQPVIREDEYDPIVTSARGGRDEEGRIFVELTLDYSRKNRYYIIISDGLSPAYQVLKKSIFDELILKKEKRHEQNETIIESYDSLEETASSRFGHLFLSLNNLFESLKNSDHNMIWRYGYEDMYGFNEY